MSTMLWYQLHVGEVYSPRGRITSQARCSGEIPGCVPVSVAMVDPLPWHEKHDDTKFWKKGTCLFFNEKNKQVTQESFDHIQAILDAKEDKRLGGQRCSSI